MLVGLSSAAAATEPAFRAGVARVDITPDYPIRLNGFGGRRAESEGVTQRIWAKALAIQHLQGGPPIVLLSIDSLGVRLPMVEEAARRLAVKHRIPRENIALVFSHSHTTPKVNGASDTIFSTPIPPEHQQHIDRYTRQLVNWLEEAADTALNQMAPATLQWTVGEVGFARNRRTPGGPVNHRLPALFVLSPQGVVRAVYVTYACHCVTLSDNKISGDWAGYAQRMAGEEVSQRGRLGVDRLRIRRQPRFRSDRRSRGCRIGSRSSDCRRGRTIA